MRVSPESMTKRRSNLFTAILTFCAEKHVLKSIDINYNFGYHRTIGVSVAGLAHCYDRVVFH